MPSLEREILQLIYQIRFKLTALIDYPKDKHHWQIIDRNLTSIEKQINKL